ncbi:MAG TPA: twin-arginine translocase TatA/TatE family subunit [Dissulfurispiraceae bacterium]|nr:twin-arginine translocase TatA/TatE family subunit [Dissulfurispiraceae bacterium]
MLSTQDLLVVLAIVAVLFGGRKLPEIGKGIGEAIKNFKKGVSDQEHIDVTPPKEETDKTAAEKTVVEKKDSKTV